MVECQPCSVVPRGDNSGHCLRLSPIHEAFDYADQDVRYPQFGVFKQAETTVEIRQVRHGVLRNCG